MAADRTTTIRKEAVDNSLFTNLASEVDPTHLIDVSLWHQRLGHASVTTLHHIPFLSRKNLHCITDSSVCPLAKQ